MQLLTVDQNLNTREILFDLILNLGKVGSYELQKMSEILLGAGTCPAGAG